MRSAVSCVLAAALAGCAAPVYLTPTGYLGLSEDDEYPESATPLMADIAARGYYAVSQVETVPYDEYLVARYEERAKYEARDGGAVYYSVESDFDLAPLPDVREWVTILERKKAVLPQASPQTP